MTTANVDQAAGIAKLQFLVNHVIETIAANSVSTKRDCYYMLKNQFQKYPWMDMNGQGESDRLIDALERITRLQRENVNIIADPKGMIYGDITLIDEEGKDFSCREREQSITGLAGQWEVKKFGVKAVIPIEKTGVFMDLKKLKVADELNLGLIHLGGRPAGPGLPGADQAALREGRPHRRTDRLLPWSNPIDKAFLSASSFCLTRLLLTPWRISSTLLPATRASSIRRPLTPNTSLRTLPIFMQQTSSMRCARFLNWPTAFTNVSRYRVSSLKSYCFPRKTRLGSIMPARHSLAIHLASTLSVFFFLSTDGFLILPGFATNTRQSPLSTWYNCLQ